MIHVFHGLFGSPEDFSFLKNDQVILHNLYHMPHPIQLTHEDVLIGYSLGGRIALELAHSNNYQLKKIVLINAHPGLQSEDEKNDRENFEMQVMRNLANKTKIDFFYWWNNLPLFLADVPIEPTDDIYQKSLDLFQGHLLSNQINFLPEIIENKDKFLIIQGSLDEKYSKIGNKLYRPNNLNIKEILGGHRLFQKPSELMKILKEENIL